MTPRLKLDDDETITPTAKEVRQCNHGGCSNPLTNVRGYRVGLVTRDSGTTSQCLYALGYCARHDREAYGIGHGAYETVNEYFERTYLEALKDNQLVRAAVDEPDKSLLLKLVRKEFAKVYSQVQGFAS